MVNQKWRNCIKLHILVNDRIKLVRFENNGESLCVIGVYAPGSGKKEESELFYSEWQKQLGMNNNMDCVVVAGDLSPRIGNQATENVTGLFGDLSLIHI